LIFATEEEVQKCLQSVKNFDAAGLSHIADVARHTRMHYQSMARITDERRISTMRAVIERVPIGSKLVILMDHDRLRLPDGTVRADPPTEHYNALMKTLVKEYPHVATVCFSEVIEGDEQIQIGGNHYDRIVYLRLAELLVQTIRALPAKSAEATSPANVRVLEIAGPLGA
jgi:hypothetical protein